MYTGIVYGYFDNKTGECIYIGIDTTEKLERHANHMKPAKKHKQKINKWLQERVEGKDWVYVEMHKLESYSYEALKENVLLIERNETNINKPIFNVYNNN